VPANAVDLYNGRKTMMVIVLVVVHAVPDLPLLVIICLTFSHVVTYKELKLCFFTMCIIFFCVLDVLLRRM